MKLPGTTGVKVIKALKKLFQYYNSDKRVISRQ